MNPADDGEIAQLAQSNVIEAIKLARARYGLDLTQAKQLVDGILHPRHPENAAGRDAELVGVLRGEGLAAALKRYRELTGCGLKEAKDAVDALARKYGTG